MHRAKSLICGLMIAMGWFGTVSSAEYPGAVIARGYPERLAFHYEGKAQVLPFGIGLKFYDTEGKELDLLEGAGILSRGNKVTIVTAEDEASKEQVVSVRLIEGTIAKPALESGVDLKPDPNFKDEVQTATLPEEWLAYFPTAKVGDYAQYKGFGRYRLEVLAIDGDVLTVARVVDTGGTRHEFRTHYAISKAQKDRLKEKPATGKTSSSLRKTASTTKAKTKSTKPAKNLTAAQKKALKEKEAREAVQAAARAKKDEPKTQPMLVDGRQLLCDVQRISVEHTRWYSPEVPFTGLVMVQRPNENEQLVAFARAK